MSSRDANIVRGTGLQRASTLCAPGLVLAKAACAAAEGCPCLAAPEEVPPASRACCAALYASSCAFLFAASCDDARCEASGHSEIDRKGEHVQQWSHQQVSPTTSSKRIPPLLYRGDAQTP